MGKHTPGKWIYEPSDMTIRTMDVSSNAGMGDHKGVIIAELDSPEWRKTRPDSIPEKEANGRLIAEAPMMYEALKEIVSLADDDPFATIGMYVEHGKGSNIRALIARIEGEK